MSTYASYLRSPYRSIKYTTYFPVYDALFTPYVGRNVTFVEIGVLDGGSLFMWRDFFGPQARIIGIDFNPQAKRWEDEGFEIFIGSQSDEAFWSGFFAAVGNVDILLDDGGHTFEQQIVTTQAVLPHINDGGLLVVEDTHTSYMPEFGGPSPLSFLGYAKNIADGINYRYSKFRQRKPAEDLVYGVRFYESFVVFEVDRKASAVVCEPTDNGGKVLDAEDYRYADSGLLSRLEAGAKRRDGLRSVPLVGGLLKALNELAFKSVRRIVTWRNNRRLRRYFRF